MSSQVVYIIESASRNVVKIGRTNDIKRRTRELQVGNPARLYTRYIIETKCFSAQEVERFLHMRWNRYKILGEWFEIPVQEIDTEIDCVKFVDDLCSHFYLGILCSRE